MYGHAAVSIENGEKGKIKNSIFRIYNNFKRSFVSAMITMGIISKRAKSLTVHPLLRHLAPIGLINTALLDFIAATQPALDAGTTIMKKRKAFLRPVGRLCLIFLCKF